MKLDNSVSAVVTGGASGLGAATARALAAKGVKVAIFDMNEAKGEAIAKEIGGVFCKVNVTSDEEVDAAFAKAREANGQERVLVNCAGTGNAARTASRDRNTGEIRHFPLAAFNMIIQINLVGTFSASKGGVVGMTLPIARDLMDIGVRVNTILPGIFDTPLMMGAPQPVRDALAASVPFPKRLGKDEEYASLALEMIRNSYFNGEDVRLDGAIRMAPR